MKSEKEQLSIDFKKIAPLVTEKISMDAAFQLSYNHDTVKDYLSGKIFNVKAGNKLLIVLQTRIMVQAGQKEDLLTISKILARMVNVLEELIKIMVLISNDSLSFKKAVEEQLTTIISLLNDLSVYQKTIRKNVPNIRKI